MNRRGYLRYLPLVIATLLVVGCSRSVPLQNIEEQRIITQSPLSLDTVKTAIIKGGQTVGWRMTVVKPNQILASLDVRKHQLVVDIVYDPDKYSIVYRDSTNLNYKGTNIHPNYRRWIDKLNREIQRALPISN